MQVSVVHALLSLQKLLPTTVVNTQPVDGLQVSIVHGFPSSHVIDSFEQPVKGSQLSKVHALLSSHV